MCLCDSQQRLQYGASTLSWKEESLTYVPFVYEHPEYWKKGREYIRRMDQRLKECIR